MRTVINIENEIYLENKHCVQAAFRNRQVQHLRVLHLYYTYG